MKNVLIFGLFFLLTLNVNAQEPQKKSKKEIRAEKETKKIEETKALVESKTFVFDARNVNPMGGRSMTLTTQYDVKVTSDSIYSYLPYFGVAYSANYGGTDSPMIFENSFETCEMEKTKNGYMVKVSVKNGNDRLDFSFHISETGSTTLHVSSINRQAISYNGEVLPYKEN